MSDLRDRKHELAARLSEVNAELSRVNHDLQRSSGRPKHERRALSARRLTLKDERARVIREATNVNRALRERRGGEPVPSPEAVRDDMRALFKRLEEDPKP